MKKPLTFSEAIYELLSSMRFAVSLLTVLAIASIIGTVLKQNEPYPNYIAQFGEFWFAIFEPLGLFDVYHAIWFILILAFLVVSTSLCLYRNTPLMWREMRSFREHATEKSLRSFAHRAEYTLASDDKKIIDRLTQYLASQKYKFKLSNPNEESTLIAAKAGSNHRLGYVLTHAAIVIICIGGLIDGNLPLKIQQALNMKKVETRNVAQSQVPPISRLQASNLSFRGNVTIPEGSSADVIFLTVGEGYMVQELPFIIHLKKFHIDHYTTGQPKSFVSDLLVEDKETGKTFAHTIKVNEPLIYKGVAIYQASFDDGGSKFKLKAWPLFSNVSNPFEFRGSVNGTTRLTNKQEEFRIEFTGFRTFNVEDVSDPASSKIDTASVSKKVLDNARSAAPVSGEKKLQNVGPSFQYKVRDAQGQAKEYSNYMLPLRLNNRWYLLSGMRASPNDQFRFVRYPLDDQASLQGYMQLRAMLFNAEARQEIAERFTKQAMQGETSNEDLRSKIMVSTVRVLEIFATRGYDALAEFLQNTVPPEEQEKAAQIYLKILENAMLHAYEMLRERAGLTPVPANEETALFLRDTLNAINDSFFYGAPVYVQLLEYEEVKASGLQLTRSPGKQVVYTGSALLVLGIFAMFYINERRIWFLLKPREQALLLAMSSNRKALDFEHEFKRHQQAVHSLIKES